MPDLPGRVATRTKGRSGVTHCGSWRLMSYSWGGEARAVCTLPPDHDGPHRTRFDGEDVAW